MPLKGNYQPDNFRLYFSDTGLLIASLDDESQEDLRAKKTLAIFFIAAMPSGIGSRVVDIASHLLEDLRVVQLEEGQCQRDS